MTDYVEVRVTDLSGAALNWAVAKATGADELKVTDSGSVCCIYEMSCGSRCWTAYYEPSTNWDYGGPLIEKHRISIVNEYQFDSLPMACVELEIGDCWHMLGSYSGATYLLAACRAIVAAKLGETVSVPKELLPC